MKLKMISLLLSSDCLLFGCAWDGTFLMTRGRRGGVANWSGGDAGRPCCFCLSFCPRVLIVDIDCGNNALEAGWWDSQGPRFSSGDKKHQRSDEAKQERRHKPGNAWMNDEFCTATDCSFSCGVEGGL